MATANTTPEVKATKIVKEKKPQVAASIRLTEQLKRSALQGKLTVDELDKLSALASALKTFITA